MRQSLGRCGMKVEAGGDVLRSLSVNRSDWEICCGERKEVARQKMPKD